MNWQSIIRSIGRAITRVALAVLGGLYAGLTYLVGVWGEQTTVSDAFTGLTAQQWGLFGIAVLGGMGVGEYAKRKQ